MHMLSKSMNKTQLKMLAKSIPLKRIATVREKIASIIFLLSSMSSHINGSSINPDGGQI